MYTYIYIQVASPTPATVLLRHDVNYQLAACRVCCAASSCVPCSMCLLLPFRLLDKEAGSYV